MDLLNLWNLYNIYSSPPFPPQLQTRSDPGRAEQEVGREHWFVGCSSFQSSLANHWPTVLHTAMLSWLQHMRPWKESMQTPLSCQYALSEVLVRWLNSFGTSLPTTPTPFQRGIRGSVSDHFCNFLKPPIRHSHALHAVIGQLFRGEKGHRIYVSSSLFFSFLTLHVCHFSCKQLSATLWMSSRRDCLKTYAVIFVFKQYCITSASPPCLPGWPFATAINSFDFWRGRTTRCTN